MIGDDLVRTAKRGLVGLAVFVAMGLLASYCTARRVERAQRNATQQADRAASRAKARQLSVLAREQFVRANAERHRADSVEQTWAVAAARSDSMLRAIRVARAKGISDSTYIALLEQQVVSDSIDRVLAAQIAPAYVRVDQFRTDAATNALVALGESEHADAVSESLGVADATSAHWRGVKQGVVGTLTAAVLIQGVRLLLHAIQP